MLVAIWSVTVTLSLPDFLTSSPDHPKSPCTVGIDNWVSLPPKQRSF